MMERKVKKMLPSIIKFAKDADETEDDIYLPLLVKLNEENHPNPREVRFHLNPELSTR